YRIEFIKHELSPAFAHPPLSFSTGQILSFGMILLGLVWLVIASRLPNREAVIHYPDTAGSRTAPPRPADKAARDAERNRRRKLRKKLK
ncbi:MAG: prolipoprotein diacylglyceryl transferase, partial [Treponema sp.]|nr:prolipoprotein diacylglyceryl transferase [Treponema sp.]